MGDFTILPILRDGRVVDFNVLPTVPFERSLNSVEGGSHTSAAAFARSVPLHSSTDSQGTQRNHA